MINHLERTHGVWFAKGGTGALVDALETVDARRRHPHRAEHHDRADRGRGWPRQRRGARRPGAHSMPMWSCRTWTRCMSTGTCCPPSCAEPVATAALKARAAFDGALRPVISARNAPGPRWRITPSGSATRYKSLLNDIFHKKVLAEDFSLYVHRPDRDRSELRARGLRQLLRALPGAQPRRWSELVGRGAKAARPDRQGAGRHHAARPVRSPSPPSSP